jgi:hypothetical protein
MLEVLPSPLAAVNSWEMQIKNFVRVAHVLATVGKVPVGFSHFKTVIKANGLSNPDSKVEMETKLLSESSHYEV